MYSKNITFSKLKMKTSNNIKIQNQQRQQLKQILQRKNNNINNNIKVQRLQSLKFRCTNIEYKKQILLLNNLNSLQNNRNIMILQKLQLKSKNKINCNNINNSNMNSNNNNHNLQFLKITTIQSKLMIFIQKLKIWKIIMKIN